MTPNRAELFDHITEVFASTEPMRFASRDISLQKHAVEELTTLTSTLKDVISLAADVDEDLANQLLSATCIADSLMKCLQMWISLKEGEADDAWDNLVESQMAANAAARAHVWGHRFAQYGEWLYAIEKTIFPAVTFVSSAHDCGRTLCSICQADYSACDHIAGRSYAGKFCSQIVLEIVNVSHVAIVDEPADKRCRFMGYNDGVPRTSYRTCFAS
jgi:hypothetical protein